MKSWLDIAPDSDFSMYNIPFGIMSVGSDSPRAATRIGDHVIDLYELSNTGLLSIAGLDGETLKESTLNSFISLGKGVTHDVRTQVQMLFDRENFIIRDDEPLKAKLIYDASKVQMHMPVRVGDYTDFYSSLHHAKNVGSMFRPDNPLLPNWKHLPVAYHGRASSIAISGTPVKRPSGQYMPVNSDTPVFGPTQALDFELELAFVIGKESKSGDSVSVRNACDYIFGFLIFNDWSARDIQSWEYQPLGPFLSKNFLSSVSPWIVTLEALVPYKVQGPYPEEDLLDYLRSDGKNNFDIQLEVFLQTEGSTPERICLTNFKHMYWNIFQQLAHHTVNGCNIRVGDMMASGTISGPVKESRGSLLELTWRGEDPLVLANGSVRKYLQDGDTIIMKGYAGQGERRVGFGEVRGKVV